MGLIDDIRWCVREVTRIARKLDGATGTDLHNSRDSMSIGGGAPPSTSSGGGGGTSADELVIIRIQTGSSYALGGTYAGYVMNRNGTAFDHTVASTLDMATYFDQGEEVVVVNTYEDLASTHILDVTGETYYMLGLRDSAVAANGLSIVWTSTPSLQSSP